MENFAAIAAEFRNAHAVKQIANPQELPNAIHDLLNNPTDIGAKGQQISLAKRGVTTTLAKQLLNLHASALPRDIHTFSQSLLAPLAYIWGSFARTGKDARSLKAPVISLGGITMGGTGKTPMAVWLSERLKAAGLQPAILTRGYRRQSPHEEIIVPAGVAAPVELTGDEAQIFVQRRVAHLGIDNDRYRVGLKLEELLHPDIFLLDDGFQHRHLARSLDIVLIDALDPFGGGSVFPLGRLREPLENLRRASAFVLTRAQPGRRTDGVEAELRKYNPQAPIFRSWVAPVRWRGGSPSGRVAAFCGLANPNTFWRLLSDLRIDPVLQWSFDDHHKYSCGEAKSMAARALEAGLEYLVTTEKDYMNWNPRSFEALGPVKLCWVEVEARFEDEAGFLKLVRQITHGTVRENYKSLL